MLVRILGSGAGGGVPQWNCGCALCVATRSGDPRVRPRTQSSLCVSADGDRWVLFNASPDVRSQINATEPLAPRGLRGSPIAAVVLTNGDIDHCAGLLVLREGGVPPIYCSERTREALTDGLRLLPALGAYGPVSVRVVAPGSSIDVHDREGLPTGITLHPFAVASKAPPYMPFISDDRARRDDLAGDTLGYVMAAGNGPRVVYVPGVRVLDDALRLQISGAACVLIDGTFATEDELIALGASTKSAQAMGHAPLFGAGGIVDFLNGIPGPRKIIVHINNSNPVLWEDGDARRALTAAGIEVGYDGMTLSA